MYIMHNTLVFQSNHVFMCMRKTLVFCSNHVFMCMHKTLVFYSNHLYIICGYRKLWYSIVTIFICVYRKLWYSVGTIFISSFTHAGQRRWSLRWPRLTLARTLPPTSRPWSWWRSWWSPAEVWVSSSTTTASLAPPRILSSMTTGSGKPTWPQSGCCPFTMQSHARGSNCVKWSWYTTLKINSKHQMKASAHFILFPVCEYSVLVYIYPVSFFSFFTQK